MKDWAAHLEKVTAVTQFQDVYDDLSDPIVALCNTAQIAAMRLHEEGRLQSTLDRAAKFISVQQSATLLAKQLRLM